MDEPPNNHVENPAMNSGDAVVEGEEKGALTDMEGEGNAEKGNMGEAINIHANNP